MKLKLTPFTKLKFMNLQKNRKKSPKIRTTTLMNDFKIFLPTKKIKSMKKY